MFETNFCAIPECTKQALPDSIYCKKHLINYLLMEVNTVRGKLSNNNVKCFGFPLHNPSYRKYMYILKNQKANSQKYGNCEVCGKYANNIWAQKESQAYLLNGELHFKINNTIFGHKRCLYKIRKKNG